MQTTQQQGGPCVELGHYGIEEELERLRRDRNLLMAEVVKLRQQQQSSKDQVIAMENRIGITETKQQQMMNFLAKAFTNPTFIQQYIDKPKEKRAQKPIEIGQKRRLTMTPSVENLQEVANIEQEIDALLNERTGILDSDEGTIWEDFLNEELVSCHEEEELFVGDEPAVDLEVEVEDLVAKSPDWGEDLQELVDQMEYLKSEL